MRIDTDCVVWVETLGKLYNLFLFKHQVWIDPKEVKYWIIIAKDPSNDVEEKLDKYPHGRG